MKDSNTPMAMTKSQILAALAERSGLAKKDVVNLMETLEHLRHGPKA